MESDKKTAKKARLTDKKYKDHKLNMTNHGLMVDFQVVVYTDEARESHRVIANDSGQCTNVYGDVLNHGDLKDQWLEEDREFMRAKYIWTMDDCGNLYVTLAENYSGTYHSSLMGGYYRPIGAGEICIDKGFIVFLNEESGHYAPQRRLDMVITELESQGFEISEPTKVFAKECDNIVRVDKWTVLEQLIEENKLNSGLEAEKLKGKWQKHQEQKQ